MKVKKEIELNGDILHSRFRETRSTQIYKSIIGFSWSFCQCPAKYIIRIEEDVFLNLKILVHSLLTNNTGDVKKAGVYTGVRSTVDIPVASEFRKSRMLSQQDSEYYSLPIILSQAYLLSMDVLQGIVPLFPQYHIFSTNDVYIAFLIKKTGVRAVNKAGFLEQIKPNLLVICDYRRIFVSFDVVINDYPNLIEESTRSESECLPKITLFPRSNKSLPQL